MCQKAQNSHDLRFESGHILSRGQNGSRSESVADSYALTILLLVDDFLFTLPISLLLISQKKKNEGKKTCVESGQHWIVFLDINNPTLVGLI